MKPWERNSVFLMGFVVGGMLASAGIMGLEARLKKQNTEKLRHYDKTGPYDATWCDYLMYDHDSDSFRCADKHGNEVLTQRTWTEIPTEPPGKRWVSP
jgi:hypothetical protein